MMMMMEGLGKNDVTVETYHYSTTIHVPQVLIATFQKVHSLRTGGVTMETYYYGHQSILMMMMTMMTTTHTHAVANAIYLPQRAMSHLSCPVLSIYLSIYLSNRSCNVSPVQPAGPVDPVSPCSPSGPCGPCGPVSPALPALPFGPCGPVNPGRPTTPCKPG